MYANQNQQFPLAPNPSGSNFSPSPLSVRPSFTFCYQKIIFTFFFSIRPRYQVFKEVCRLFLHLKHRLPLSLSPLLRLSPVRKVIMALRAHTLKSHRVSVHREATAKNSNGFVNRPRFRKSSSLASYNPVRSHGLVVPAAQMISRTSFLHRSLSRAMMYFLQMQSTSVTKVTRRFPSVEAFTR